MADANAAMDLVEIVAKEAFAAYRAERERQGKPCPAWEEGTEDHRDRFRAIAHRFLDAEAGLSSETRYIPAPTDKEQDLAPDGSPRRAVALVLRMHGDSDKEVGTQLRHLAMAFYDGDTTEARVDDGPHLTAGYSLSYTLFVKRRPITAAEWRKELGEWMRTERARRGMIRP